MSSRPARTFITVVMDILVVLAIVLTATLVVVFFGQLAVQPWARSLVALTRPLIIPFGIAPIKTPYGGIFSVNIALTIVVLLVVEWVLSAVRSRV